MKLLAHLVCIVTLLSAYQMFASCKDLVLQKEKGKNQNETEYSLAGQVGKKIKALMTITPGSGETPMILHFKFTGDKMLLGEFILSASAAESLTKKIVVEKNNLVFAEDYQSSLSCLVLRILDDLKNQYKTEYRISQNVVESLYKTIIIPKALNGLTKDFTMLRAYLSV